jgi:hypothetical protein
MKGSYRNSWIQAAGIRVFAWTGRTILTIKDIAMLTMSLFGQSSHCGGRMRILCAINPPEATKKILDCLGLPSRPPPIFPAVLERPNDS